MAQLVQLREQIRAVQTTKKITHAVRLVSMSMYAKLEKLSTPHNAYLRSIAVFFNSLLSRNPEWKHPVFSSDDLMDSKPLYIVVSTAKGLCGSLNSNMFRFLDQTLFLQPHQTAEFIVLGQRGIKYIKSKNWGEVIYAYQELNSNNYMTIAEDIVDRIITSTKGYSSVTFFSPYLQSFFHQQPKKSPLLPLQKEGVSFYSDDKEMESWAASFGDEPIIEQCLEDLLEYAAKSCTQAFVLNTLFQSLLAEHAARFLAMDSSTNNAEKYLEKLTLHYNKIRQAVITREVAELSSNTLSR